MGRLVESRAVVAAAALALAVSGLASCGSTTEEADTADASTGHVDSGAPDTLRQDSEAPGDASDGAVDAPTHVERPAAPAWSPPFSLGSPGWRQSSEPLCTERFGATRVRVWSDEQAVFALVSASCNPLADIACGGEGTTLYENTGSAWAPLKTWAAVTPNGSGPTGLTGFVGGSLVVYPDEWCISFVDRSGNVQCSWENTAGDYLPSVFAVGSAAYAVAGKQVWGYSSTWGQIGTLAADVGEATTVRANADTVVVAGYSQLALRGSPSGSFAPLSAVPAGDYTSAWVFGRDDIWLANNFGQLVHFNGASWRTIDTQIEDSINGLWGASDGSLYFYSPRAFGRWDGQKVDIFAQATLEQSSVFQFTDMWGNSPSEIFLGVIQIDFRKYECSGVFSVWFDGAEFHLF